MITQLQTYEEEHAAIIHRLRSQGWNRFDAMEEADRLMAERTMRREQQNVDHEVDFQYHRIGCD